MTTIEDDFGIDNDRYPKPKRDKTSRAKDLGPLHALLTRGLPDFLDKKGELDTRKLAKEIAISYQALYKWFENSRVSKKRLATILHLSENTKNKPTKEANGGVKWEPLVRDDFWDFLSR